MKRLLKKLYRGVWGQLMDDYPRALDREIARENRTLLDIGCGASSPLAHVARRMEYSVGVDAHAPSLEESRRAAIHSDHVLLQVTDLKQHFEPASFDCVAATDLIEHLEKADGERLLEDMEHIARRQVVIFTPNGFLPQSAYDGNPFQEHRSGWSVEEMQARGYHVIGIRGWKPLRGERGLIRPRPRLLWEPLSLLSQLAVEKRPQHAFQILCIKNLT